MEPRGAVIQVAVKVRPRQLTVDYQAVWRLDEDDLDVQRVGVVPAA